MIQVKIAKIVISFFVFNFDVIFYFFIVTFSTFSVVIIGIIICFLFIIFQNLVILLIGWVLTNRMSFAGSIMLLHPKRTRVTIHYALG